MNLRSTTKKTMSMVMFLALCSLTFLSAPAFSADLSARPLDIIQEGTNRVLRVLNAQQADTQARRQELRRISDEYFDFEEMARRSLGQYWNRQPPRKQQEFVTLFSQFLYNTYIEKVEENRGANVTFTEQQVQGDTATVASRAVVPQKPPVSIDYRLHRKDGKWSVYDVVIEGVSLVNNYRSQFASILSKDSFDKLLQQLREKT